MPIGDRLATPGTIRARDYHRGDHRRNNDELHRRHVDVRGFRERSAAKLREREECHRQPERQLKKYTGSEGHLCEAKRQREEEEEAAREGSAEI